MKTIKDRSHYTHRYNKIFNKRYNNANITKINNMYNYDALEDYVLAHNNRYIEDENDFHDCFLDIMYDIRKISKLKCLSEFLGYCGLGYVITNFKIKARNNKLYAFKIIKKANNARTIRTKKAKYNTTIKGRCYNGYKK